MRLTLKTINDELAKRGHTARLEKSDGYFYFHFGEAADWLDRTVRVRTISGDPGCSQPHRLLEAGFLDRPTPLSSAGFSRSRISRSNAFT